VNPAAVIAIVSAAVSVLVGVLARQLARAPGCGEQRWFSVVAFSAAAYALANLGTTLPAEPSAVVWLSRVQVAAVAIHLWGWLRYSQTLLGRGASRVERIAAPALVAFAPVALVPGTVFGSTVVDRPFAPLGVVYRQTLSTPAGDVAFAVLLAAGVAIAVRFVRAWRAGVPHAGAFAAACATVVAFALCDALATSLLLPLPFLLDTGFAAPVVAVGWTMTSRFIESARSLEVLRTELSTQVEERSRALSSALQSLHQAERLAAVGQFARGVAHEVNNPAAVVTASLGFLAEAAAEPGAPPLDPEAAEALADARAAMARITALVRKLVDAGRIAVASAGPASTDVAGTLAKVLELQPEPLRAGVRVDASSLAGASVRLRPDALEQVLESLLRNAAEAVPEGRAGTVEIRGSREAGRVRITVADDGVGMTADVLRRAFDPFFTTKPDGRGSGLGLPVARGLVEGSGGALWLESEEGRGTRAFVELPEASRPADAAGA
jgi:signal transduction histidine kinase